MKKWIERYKNPSAEQRPHPFWSWNDKLEEGELRRQIAEFAAAGDGGFFMHARGGLETPYMKGEWFDLVRACVDESKKQGVRAWCYDELGWPSGSAGGDVPALGDEYCCRWLRLRDYEGKTDGDVIGFYAVKDDGSYRFLGEESSSAICGEDERIKYATSFTDDVYFDILDPKVVRAFIEHTYDSYDRESLGELNGGALLGFFTDEPQYALCKNPWSLIIPEEFERAYGYSIIPHIPGLFLGRDGHEKVRFDFWRLVNRLYTESFAKQIYDWCNEHGCLLTGHVMMEDNLICQIHCTAGCMPTYEYMHIPGIDWLGRGTAGDRLSGDCGNPLISLQVGSVAAQLGKKQVLTETYAMSGWDVSFAEMRHLVEWQFLGGVNLVCQHLSPYSIRGHRKNDYPPAVFYQSPWFEEYKTFADTVSRLGMILAEGRDDPDVLMIHPMHSIWLKYTNDDMNAEGDFDNIFTNTVLRVAQAHLPFHLGDETVIARHGKVEGDRFTVGECSYGTVLIPNIWGLDRTTFELLCAFAENGGHVALLGGAPEFIDGVACPDEICRLTDRCDRVALHEGGAGFENLMRYISRLGLRRISVTGREGEEKSIGLCVRHFPEDGKTAYFLVNNDKSSSHTVTVTLPESDAVLLHVDSMRTEALKTRRTSDGIALELTFAPWESRLIIAGDGVSDGAGVRGASLELPLDASTSEWRVGEDSDPNCYLLEHCRVGNGEVWSDEVHGMRVDGMLCDDSRFSGVDARIKYEFTVDEESDLSAMADVRFITEVALPAKVSINGADAPLLEGEWWLDHTFSAFGIGAHLVHGVNEIILSGFCHAAQRDGREVLVPNSGFSFGYLTGSFGVFSDGEFLSADRRAIVCDGPFRLGDRPTRITGGNIVTQGFPFFAGRMILERDVDVPSLGIPRHVKLDSLYASYARVVVNGRRGELLAWGELKEDVTDRLRDGVNTVGVEFTVGNRNLLGPHHMPNPAVESPGPGDFTPSIYDYKWKRRYSFIKQGVGE